MNFLKEKGRAGKMAKRKTGLGRGLDALFADSAPIFEEDEDAAGSSVREDFKDAYKADSGRSKDEIGAANESGRAKGSFRSSKTGNAGKEESDSAKMNTRSKKTSVSDRRGRDRRAFSIGVGSGAQNGDIAENDENYDNRIIYVDINDIKPNAAQPRKRFDEERLNELAISIRENGMIQPPVVRKTKNGYELVAGERRWRASRIAGLKKIPCIVRDFDEKQNMIAAIIENMQREDLDPIDEATGLHQMIEKFEFTQEQISGSLGKSRAYIANSMRLLKLPSGIQEMIRDGRITAAHGRTIINVGSEDLQRRICDRIVKEGLSVRATEKIAEKAKDESKTPRNPYRKRKTRQSADMIAAENELRDIFGTKVSIAGTESSGKIAIDYYSRDDLNALIDKLRAAR